MAHFSARRERLIVVGLLLIGIVALAALWSVWDAVARRRLRSAIAAVQARGEPLWPGDFDRRFLPPSQNALTTLSAAATDVATNSNAGIYGPSDSNNTYAGYPPFPPSWHQLADSTVAANGPALALARVARNQPEASWGNGLPSAAGLLAMGGSLNQFRELANLLGDAALHADVHGNDAEAIERVRDLLHLDDAVTAQQTLIGRLVGIGIESLAIDRLEVISADGLRIGTADAGGSVPPEVVQWLIAELLRRSHDSAVRVRCLQTERAMALRDLTGTIERATVLRPVLELEGVHFLGQLDALLQAAAQLDAPAAEMTLRDAGLPTTYTAPPRSSAATLPRFSRAYSNNSLQFFAGGVYLEVEFRMQAEVRVAAISLAARSYFDRHGHWPARLEALTPDLLPAVPTTPMARDSAFHYRLIAGSSGQPARPVIWFATKAYTFVNAVAAGPPASPAFSWQTADQWRDLSLDRWLGGRTPRDATATATTSPSG